MTTNKEAITVLLADDDMSIIKAICRRLRGENINLIVAADGYQAVHLAREHAPDVLVLDVNMPAGDGFSVMDRLSALPGKSGIPVIYITGERSERVERDARETGAYAVLYKPFDSNDLIKHILSAVRDEAA